MEIEIKYSPLSYDEFARILSHLSITQTDTIKMGAAYYDNSSRELVTNRSAFRCRRENEKTIWTLKTTQPTQGGLSHRAEHEHETPQIECAIAALAPLAPPAVAAALHTALMVVAQMSFVRTQAIYHINKSTVLLSYDRGDMSHGDKQGTIGEMEIELQIGDEQDLIALAKTLETAFPLIQDPISKLQKALSL